MVDVLGADNRPMIGDTQARFIREALDRSMNAKQPWRFLGNAVPMARMHLPDLAHLQFVTARRNEAGIAELLWKSHHNLPWYTDTWDGYPAARESFYRLCADAGVHDLVVLTGDSHSFWFNSLADAQGHPVGIELGTAGVTSPGDFLDQGFSREQAEQLDRTLEQGIAEVEWTDGVHNGYLRVDITRDRIEAECIAVTTVERPDASTQILKRAIITRQGAALRIEVDPENRTMG